MFNDEEFSGRLLSGEDESEALRSDNALYRSEKDDFSIYGYDPNPIQRAADALFKAATLGQSSSPSYIIENSENSEYYEVSEKVGTKLYMSIDPHTMLE